MCGERRGKGECTGTRVKPETPQTGKPETKVGLGAETVEEVVVLVGKAAAEAVVRRSAAEARRRGKCMIEDWELLEMVTAEAI